MFPGYIDSFPGLLLMELLISYPRLVHWSGGKISIFPSKMVQEKIQYAQEMSQEAPGNMSRSSGVITAIYVNVIVALSATKYASFMVIRIILQVHQFGFPGVSGNFNYFLHRFPGNIFWV